MRVPKQVVEARRSRLTELLLERGYLPISDLCEELGVSEATARRDLSALEGEDRITRTYGGALGEFNANFTSFRERLRHGTGAKGSIARAAVSLIKPGMRVYLDAGTTAFAIAQELRRHLPERLTIITNNLASAWIARSWGRSPPNISSPGRAFARSSATSRFRNSARRASRSSRASCLRAPPDFSRCPRTPIILPLISGPRAGASCSARSGKVA